jgi:hypothetical protein
LYVASEDRIGVITRMLAAARATVGPENDDLPVVILSLSCPVTSSDFLPAMLEAARHFEDRLSTRTALFCLDTLGAAFEGDSLSDDKPMTIATGNLLRISHDLECAVLVVSHSGKDVSRGERGSKVLRDRADATIMLSASSRKSGNAVTASVEKMRNGPAGATFEFETQAYDLVFPDAEPIQTLIVGEIRDGLDRTTGSSKSGDDARIINKSDARLFEELCRHDGDLIGPRDWTAASARAFADKASGPRRTAASKAKRRLAEAGLIAVEGAIVTITGVLPERFRMLPGNGAEVLPDTVTTAPPIGRAVTSVTPPRRTGRSRSQGSPSANGRGGLL